MIRVILMTLVMIMTPYGISHAESNNNTVWENINQAETDDSNKEINPGPTTEIGLGEAVRTFFSLIFVIGLIIGIFYYIKKRKTNGLNEDNLFENLGGFPLGNQRSLQVVRMNNRVFILGVSDSIQLIKEIDDAEEVRELIHIQSQTAENHFATKFQNQLEQIKLSNTDTLGKLLRKEKNND